MFSLSEIMIDMKRDQSKTNQKKNNIRIFMNAND